MLEHPLTLAQFEPLLGSTFTVQLGDSACVSARLIEAQAGRFPSPQGRAPFSLTFETHVEPALPQST